MSFLRSLLERFSGDKKKAAIAGGAIVGLITITATQVVSPGTEEPTGFPTPESVGPAVDPTITYSGDCTVTPAESGTLIENRIIDCEDDALRFQAGVENVVIRDSIVLGALYTAEYTPGDPGADDFPHVPVFTIEDSDIIHTSPLSPLDRPVCCSHYIVRRTYMLGKHSGAGGHNNVILEGNYITTDGTDTHSSGIRILKNSVVQGNTIVCKPVTPGSDGGCSAAGVFYAEDLSGAPTASFNLTIDGNYFKRGVTAAGEPGGPWNATRFIDCDARNDCVNNHFTNNMFDLGWNTDAGEFPLSYGGNTWEGNYWVDDQPAESGEAR